MRKTVARKILTSTMFVTLQLAGCTTDVEKEQSSSSKPVTNAESTEENSKSSLEVESRSNNEQLDPFLNRISSNICFASVFDLKMIRPLRENDPSQIGLLDSNKQFGIDPQKCDRIMFLLGVYPKVRLVNDDEEHPEFEEFGKQVASAVLLEMTGQIDEDALLKVLGIEIEEPVEIETPFGIVYQIDYQGTMLFFGKEGTIIWGDAPAVFDLIEVKDKTNLVRDRVYQYKQHPAFAIYSGPPLQEFLRQERHLDPFLPQYEYIDAGLTEVESGAFILGVERGSDSKLVLRGRSSQSMTIMKDSLSTLLRALSGWMEQAIAKVEIYLKSSNPVPSGRELISLLRNSTIETNERELSLKLSPGDGLAMVRGLLEGAAEVAQLRADLSQQKWALKKIGLAVHEYHEDHNEFPFEPIRNPAGEALLSWRVRILPYLSNSIPFGLLSRGPRRIPEFHLDEPWDSEHNLTLLSKIPTPFRDPEDPTGTKTRFCVPRGPQLMSDPNRSVSFKKIGDGVAQTLMIYQTDAEHAIEWTKPDESQFNLQDPSANLEKSGGVCLVQFCDTSVGFIDAKTTREDWLALATIDGEESLEPRTIEPYDLNIISWRELKYYSSLYETRQKMQRLSGYLMDSRTKKMIPRSNQDSNGKPLLSWRVHLLPKLGYSELYEEFRLDEPWDSPHNLPLVAKIPPIYQRPGGPADGKTNYLVPVGEKSIFEREGISKESIIPSGGGDGFGSVIFLVEVDDDHAVPWTKPEDYQYDPSQPRLFLGSNYPHGFLVGLGNVPSQLVHIDFPDDDLRALFDYQSGKDVSYETLESFLGYP